MSQRPKAEDAAHYGKWEVGDVVTTTDFKCRYVYDGKQWARIEVKLMGGNAPEDLAPTPDR